MGSRLAVPLLLAAPPLLPPPPPPPLAFLPPPPPPLLPPPPPAPPSARAPFPEVPVIPEAESLGLLAAGLAGLGVLVAALRRRRRD